MKICMFTRSLLAHSIGGMELHIETLTKTLSEYGIDVSIITTSHPSGLKHEEKNGVKIYYVSGTKIGKYNNTWWTGSIKKFVELNSIKKFDIVHSQSAGAYFFLKKKINKKFNIPVVVSLHGTSIDEIKTKLRLGFNIKTLGILKNLYYYFFIDRYYLSNCDSIIATSDTQAKVIKKYYPVTEEKINLIYNGIDENMFSQKVINKNLLQELNINQEEKIILSIARLKKEKGVQNIITILPEILKTIPNIKLLIIGDGEYKNCLVELVSKLKIEKKVLFLGKKSYETLPDYFNLCDIFVNSTIRENGYDLTILQGMSCEKPVISSDVKSVFTVIKDSNNGMIYKRNNLIELKQKIIQLLNNKELRNKIGTEARKTVLEKFSLKSMTEKTVEVYNRLLNSSL